MKWNSTDAAGVKHADNVRFIDKDNVEWSMVTGPEEKSSLSCPPNNPAANSEDT
jgi:hypothetical protein